MAGFLGKQQATMSRRESAVWIGRALSTNEVVLRVILQLVSITAAQQHVIQALFEQHRNEIDREKFPGVYDEMEQGASETLLKKMAEIQAQLEPILKVVSDACSTLEKEL